MVTGQFPSSVSAIVSHDGARLYLEEGLRRGRTRRLPTTGRGPEDQLRGFLAGLSVVVGRREERT